MTSRKAQRRMHNSKTDSATTVNGQVIFAERSQWPKFYWLWEHDRRHTVILLPTPNALLEVEQMMRKGNALCTHKGELGECIHIEKATIEEWLATHPGEQ